MHGTLIDVFSDKNELVLWIRYGTQNLFLRDAYKPVFFIQSREHDLISIADTISTEFPGDDYVIRLVKKRDFDTNRLQDALQVQVKDFRKRSKLVRFLNTEYQFESNLFHADLSVEQLYLFEKNLRPLQDVEFGVQGKRIWFLQPLKFQAFTDEFPAFTHVTVEAIPKGDVRQTNEIALEAMRLDEQFFRGSEDEILLQFKNAYEKKDPDIVLSVSGNKWMLEYVKQRFLFHRIPFEWGRFSDKAGGKPSSYFSYGQIIRRDLSHFLCGRLHIDTSGFHFKECGLDGVLEMAYTTAMPVQKAGFKSSGSCISNLQLFYAYQQGYLIPDRKNQVEKFDSGWHLFEVDKGGMVFEPRIGLHENVVELDFSSLYPSIMVEHNISPETVLCHCCDNDVVPECHYNICEKRRGLIPIVLKPVLERRLYFKRMKSMTKGKERETYKQKANALKWLLVTSFGYTGYKNARFGRIECHEAICAYSREKLLSAARICEDAGFEVLHAIVDSVYITKPGFSLDDLSALINTITEKTRVEIVLEGIFNWIVFVPSRRDHRIATPTRFYGVYQNGEAKLRGLEIRRRDSPTAIKKMQSEQIAILSKATDKTLFEKQIPKVKRKMKEWIQKLHNGLIPFEELVITKRVSKPLSKYRGTNAQKTVLTQLARRGIEIHPGEKIRFLYTKTDSSQPEKRVTAYSNQTPPVTVDHKKYEELFVNATWELLHFNGTKKEELFETLFDQQQTKLNAFSETKPAKMSRHG